MAKNPISQEIKAGLAAALKEALAKHEESLRATIDAEAAGAAKLEKNATAGYGPKAAGIGDQSPKMVKTTMAMALPHKTVHPEVQASLNELRGIRAGAPAPTPAPAAKVAAPQAAARPTDKEIPVGTDMVVPSSKITGAEKRAAGIGFLGSLISRFKGIGNKGWEEARGSGPVSAARAARTAATRMALSEKKSETVAKATAAEANKEIKGFKSLANNPMSVRGNVGSVVKPGGVSVAKEEAGPHSFESKKKPSRLESDIKTCKTCGKPADDHKKEDIKKACGEMAKAAMNAVPAAPKPPKPPAAAKPAGTPAKPPGLGKTGADPSKPESKGNPPAERTDKDKMDTLFGADPKPLHPSDKKKTRVKLPGKK
jgi:hypothetical protein